MRSINCLLFALVLSGKLDQHHVRRSRKWSARTLNSHHVATGIDAFDKQHRK